MRTLALLLALVMAPQAALASVAAFPETALRGDREISAIRTPANARQLADVRRETACFYDSNASAMTDDPINHRDPTGRGIIELGMLPGVLASLGPRAALGFYLRSTQNDASAALSMAVAPFDPLGVWTGGLTELLHPTTAASGDEGFAKLNPAYQALRSGQEAIRTSGYERGVQVADSTKALLDTLNLGLAAAGGVSAISRRLEISGVPDTLIAQHQVGDAASGGAGEFNSAGQMARRGARASIPQQGAMDCGPTCLRMVAETVSPGTAGALEEISVDPLRGTSINKFPNALEQASIGSEWRVRQGVAELEAATRSGRPAIVHVFTEGPGPGHFLVVDGITVRNGTKVVAIRDPAGGRQYFETLKSFMLRFSGQAIILK